MSILMWWDVQWAPSGDLEHPAAPPAITSRPQPHGHPSPLCAAWGAYAGLREVYSREAGTTVPMIVAHVAVTP